MNLRKSTFSAILLAVLTLITDVSLAQSKEAQKRIDNFNLTKKKVAIEGYDPVAYFTENKAIKGNKAHAVYYEGVLYLFANDKNKTLFKKSPAKYEPQYGGWCAYAIAEKSQKMEIDPETFLIQEGKLYLFYNRFFNNTLPDWQKAPKVNKEKGDKNWDKLYQK
ncbi:MAG: YHS domain-containing (seleno)protein [Thermonemataceae bacterium]